MLYNMVSFISMMVFFFSLLLSQCTTLRCKDGVSVFARRSYIASLTRQCSPRKGTIKIITPGINSMLCTLQYDAVINWIANHMYIWFNWSNNLVCCCITIYRVAFLAAVISRCRWSHPYGFFNAYLLNRNNKTIYIIINIVLLRLSCLNTYWDLSYI